MMLTPKQKARELVNEFSIVGLHSKMDGIECALIAVNEIINNVLVGIDLPSTWGNYWNEVKQEIEKL